MIVKVSDPTYVFLYYLSWFKLIIESSDLQRGHDFHD